MKDRLLYTALALAAALNLTAQESVSKQITVERIVVPEQRAAIRPLVMPKMLAPALAKTDLDYAFYSRPSQITPSLAFSEPVAWADTLPANPYRGYAALGYLPAYNLGASLGVRLVDNARTLVDAWAQFDGLKYKPIEATDDARYLDNTLAIGLDIHQRLGHNSALTASVDYNLTHVNQPDILLPSEGEALALNMSRISATVGLQGKADAVSYQATLNAGYSGWSEQCPLIYSPVKSLKETLLGVQGTVGYALCDNGGMAALDVDVSYVGDNSQCRYVRLDNRWEPLYSGKGKGRALISLTPVYSLLNGPVTLRLGARIDISVNGTKTLHIAPDVQIAYNPTPLFDIHARAGGGEMLNSATTMWQFSHWLTPGFTSFFSHQPWEVSGGITIGRKQGFALCLDAAYARVNDWQAPASVATADAAVRPFILQPQNIKGWMASATASYDWRGLVIVKAWYKTAPSSATRCWYQWRDRAHWTAGGSLTVRPLRSVDVTVAYDYRSGRRGLVLDDAGSHIANLRAIGNIDLTAQWRITDALTLMADVQNLGNRRYYLAPGISAPGITGLVGAALRF